MLIRELLGEAKGADQKSAKGADYRNEQRAGSKSGKAMSAAQKALAPLEKIRMEVKRARKDKDPALPELQEKMKKLQTAYNAAKSGAQDTEVSRVVAHKDNRNANDAEYASKNGVATPETKADMKAVADTVDQRRYEMTTKGKAEKAKKEKEAKEKEEAAKEKTNESYGRPAKPSPLTRFLAEIAQKPKAPLGSRGKTVNAKAAAAKAQNKEANDAYDKIGKVGAKGDDASDEDNADMKSAQDKLKNMKSADTKPRVKGKPQENQEARQAKRAIAAKKEADHEAAMTGPAND